MIRIPTDKPSMNLDGHFIENSLIFEVLNFTVSMSCGILGPWRSTPSCLASLHKYRIGTLMLFDFPRRYELHPEKSCGSLVYRSQ